MLCAELVCCYVLNWYVVTCWTGMLRAELVCYGLNWYVMGRTAMLWVELVCYGLNWYVMGLTGMLRAALPRYSDVNQCWPHAVSFKNDAWHRSECSPIFGRVIALFPASAPSRPTKFHCAGGRWKRFDRKWTSPTEKLVTPLNEGRNTQAVSELDIILVRTKNWGSWHHLFT